MSNIAIKIDGIGKCYTIGARQRGYHNYQTIRDTVSGFARGSLDFVKNGFRSGPAEETNEVWAVKNVSFEVKKGDVVGIIGSNGAGKSTLLKLLSRITEPTRGYANIYGRVGALLEVGTGFHAELTGRENLLLNGAILGMSRKEILRKFDEIVDFAGVEKFIDTPVKFYSSGMYLRLAFAVAAHLEPEILVVDEVLAVGDTAFQKKCIGRMEAVAQEGRTVLFVSHNMGAVRSLCNKAVYLHQGESEGISEVGECIGRYFEAVGAMPGKQNGQDADIPTAGFGRVMVFDGTGNTVLNSEECEISTTFKFDPGYSGFTIFGILEDMHGKMVFQLRRENFEIGAKDCPPGIYRIKLRLPALWLNPGLYAFHFKAILSGDGITKQVSDKFPLDVDGVHSTKVDCILNPMDKWEVIPEST